jgi:hypothetical protein
MAPKGFLSELSRIDGGILVKKLFREPIPKGFLIGFPRIDGVGFWVET